MQINIGTCKKRIKYLRQLRVREFCIRIVERLNIQKFLYDGWFRKHAITKEQEKAQREDVKRWKKQPIISIICYISKDEALYVREVVEAVKRQTYPFWQLCLITESGMIQLEESLKIYCKDDERIKFFTLSNSEKPKNVNDVIEKSLGEWICLLSEDSVLEPEALYEILVAAGVMEGKESLLQQKEYRVIGDVVYVDEDKLKVKTKRYFEPNFKPDYSIDLLRSNNYIGQFFIVKRKLAEQVGGFRGAYDVAQVYDFVLRCTSSAQNVVHVPRVLYHQWQRDSDKRTDLERENADSRCRRIIEKHLCENGLQTQVIPTENMGYYRVKYLITEREKISIIIPNKDQVEMLRKCIASIVKSTYTNYEIIIVENNSEQTETFAYYESLIGTGYTAKAVMEGTLINGNRICVITWKDSFNYSAINNFGVTFTKGDYLLFLNNDVEVMSEDWMEELLGHCQRKEVAAVGCKLLYPDGTIQHAGVGVGLGGIANSMFVGMHNNDSSYMHRADLQVNYSAVTAACMLVKKRIFCEVGGFEEKLAVAYNDIDLCLKMRKAGYWIVYTPYAVAVHYESKSRGKEDTPEKQQRLKTESDFMIKKWRGILASGDPFYNPNLSKRRMDYTIDYS